MLKKSAPLKVLLVHPTRERFRGMGHEPIGGPESTEGQTERVFIAKEMLVVKVGVFVEPEGQTQGRPAASFVHDELTALELRFSGNLESATPPDCVGFP